MVRRTVFLVVAAAVLAACAFPVACAGSYAADERRSIATQIWEDIKLRYSYFHDKGMNWDEVGRVYIGAAEAAESDRQFFAAIAGMVRELRDGHSYVYEYPQPLGGSHGSPAVELALIEGRPVVVGVAEGSDAEGLGVAVGMEVLRVDGMDAGQLLRELEGGVTASTPWSARAIAARALLAGPLDQDVEVELGTEAEACCGCGLRGGRARDGKSTRSAPRCWTGTSGTSGWHRSPSGCWALVRRRSSGRRSTRRWRSSGAAGP